jgi:acyl-CoA reductase-like NAD-dependent aldehyde dehydrogenase
VHQKKLNGGSNCLDLQVLVVAKSWPQKGDFLEEVKRLAVETDTPVCYYPGVGKTYVSMKERYAKAGKLLLDGKTGNDVTMVDCGVHGAAGFDNHATKHEAFCPILAWVEVDGGLGDMVDFVNSDDVCGSLSCALMSPKTADEEEVEAALRGLKYGTVAHNVSNLLGYTTISLGGIWGAYPTELRSGVGIVGNIYGVKGVVKQILRSSGGLEKMGVDLSKGIPPLLADVLHKALNVGGGGLGVVGTIGRVWWMLLRRSAHNVGVKAYLIDERARLPGSAVLQVE